MRATTTPASKRAFDLLVGVLGLLLFSLVMLFIAVAVRLDSRGPALYKGARIGRGGRPFRMLKFRTMVVDADRIGASSTGDDDPRVTRVGRLLRRVKLDELPQLFNVLAGQMSFVGPRPQVPWIVDMFSHEEREILTVRPGIADYAFVLMPREGDVLRSSADPDGDYLRKLHPLKMRLSLEFVRRRSFALDLAVLVDAAMLSFIGRPLFLRRARTEALRQIPA